MISLNIFKPFPFLLGLQVTPALEFLLQSHRFLKFCSFSFPLCLFSLYCSDWLISLVSSWNSLILSFVPCALQLSPFIEYSVLKFLFILLFFCFSFLSSYLFPPQAFYFTCFKFFYDCWWDYFYVGCFKSFISTSIYWLSLLIQFEISWFLVWWVIFSWNSDSWGLVLITFWVLLKFCIFQAPLILLCWVMEMPPHLLWGGGASSAQPSSTTVRGGLPGAFLPLSHSESHGSSLRPSPLTPHKQVELRVPVPKSVPFPMLLKMWRGKHRGKHVATAWTR